MQHVCPARFLLVLICGTAVLSLTVEPAIAQSNSRGSTTRRVQSGSGSPSSGSGTTRQGTTTRRGRTQGKFEAQLWTYLQKQKYRNWAPVPGQSDARYPGQSPHGAFLKMYLNRTAAGNASTLPDRSIVVKENYAEDGKTLAAITVMYRSKGYNPDAGDWYWIKYNPDGTVASTPPAKGSVNLSGRPKGCIDCHNNAEGNDFAFFNDEL